MASSLVLLPTYNELDNLRRVVPRISALEDEVDVLVIDDASPDGTGELAEELRGEYPRLSVLHRRAKEGLGRAYVHGFREALRRGYRRIVTMDADLSHSPEDVPRLLRALDEADIAVGSRHAPGGGVEDWPRSRRFLSRGGSLYARSLLRLPVRDATSGFRAYRAEALREIDLGALKARGFVFQVEVLRRILDLPGSKAVEIPIVFKNRAAGRSKLTREVIREATVEVARLAFRKRILPRRTYDAFTSRRRFEPEVTVVVPTRPESPEPMAVSSLGSLDYPSEKLEIIVARGTSPSVERNAAVRSGSGELILFLDDDSLPTPELLSTYVSAFERDPTLGAVGGPAEATEEGGFSDLAALVLGEPWVMGKSAARYRALGEARFTDERQLILCNLCVKRAAFEEAGGFNESLYPNEENELLERLRRRGWRLLYRPEALVKRPQRRTLPALLSAVHGYGRGRAAQLRSLPTRTSGKMLLLVLGAFLGCIATMLGIIRSEPSLFLPLAVYGVYLFLLTLKLQARAGVKKGCLAAVVGAMVHGSYALGLLRGLLSRHQVRTVSEVTIEKWRSQ